MSFEMILGNRNVTNPPENKEASADEQNISNSEPEKPHNHAAIQKMIDSNNILMKNFNECIHKSEVMDYEVKSCCHGTEKRRGLTCLRFGHLDLNPLVCSLCRFSEFREEASQ